MPSALVADGRDYDRSRFRERYDQQGNPGVTGLLAIPLHGIFTSFHAQD